MQFKKSYLVAITIIIVTAGIFFSFRFGFQQFQETEPPEEEQSESSGKYFKNVDFVLFNEPKTVKWLMKAETMHQQEQRERVRLNPVAVDAFESGPEEAGDSQGEVTDASLEELTRKQGGPPLYDLTGEEGWYFSRERRLEVSGPVTINRKPYTLNSTSLTWYQQQNQVEGKGGVELEGPDFVLTGDYFEADTALTYFRVSGQDKQAHLIWEEQGDKHEDN